MLMMMRIVIRGKRLINPNGTTTTKFFYVFFPRFLHFGFGGDKSGGSGGGSGNFLFDIIRVSILLTINPVQTAKENN